MVAFQRTVVVTLLLADCLRLSVPLETPSRIVQALATRGYNAEREAVTLVASAEDPRAVLERAVEEAPPDALVITRGHVRTALREDSGRSASQTTAQESASGPAQDGTDSADLPTDSAPSVSSAPPKEASEKSLEESPVETGESADSGDDDRTGDPQAADGANVEPSEKPRTGSESPSGSSSPKAPAQRSVDVLGDVTGRSTGTGEYEEFVRTFRDRYERLSNLFSGRVNHRPIESIAGMTGGSEAAMVGLVNDVRSTASGHWLIELEDTTGTFPTLVMKDKDVADVVEELLLDECLAVEGTLADDGGLLFADAIHFPDVPRTYRPSTADRHVQAVLVSDLHIGSQEFAADAWDTFTDWLHTDEAAAVEYLLIAGDMVEGVGVYPEQDQELEIVDIYAQYEAFSERLKAVPGDIEIVMIPGNHDAVRLAEPQPGFDDELRTIMSAHDSRIVGNPVTVSLEGVSILMYHGVSLDEVIAELPEAKASYDEPQRAMAQLLKKRHLAPQYGGHIRLAPEDQDYLVIDEIPDVFHAGHVHKVGWGEYHNILTINTGCWQEQTAFQRSVNIDPDIGFAPVLDLDTLDLTVRKFS